LEGAGDNDIDRDNNNKTPVTSGLLNDNELNTEKVQRQYANIEDLAQSGVRTIESSAVPTLDDKISETVNTNDQLRMMTNLKERQLEHLVEEKNKLMDSLSSLKFLRSKIEHDIRELESRVEKETIKNQLLEERRSVLTAKLDVLEKENQKKDLESQVKALEAFIEDKISYSTISKCDLDYLNNSLGILSDQKRSNICRLINAEAEKK